MKISSSLIKQKNIVVKNIRKYFSDNKIKNAIIGISGGIDSAVGINILIEALSIDKVKPFFIDIDSNKQDYEHAKKLCESLNIKLEYINLTKTFKKVSKAFNEQDRLGLANLKSRLRAIFLYDKAFQHQGIVCANSNLDELYVGYFTKYGDSACDIFILNNFIKRDIRELAKHYHVIEEIINKAPSAGLYKGQTDEQEMGVTYEEIDNYLMNKKISSKSKEKIEKLHNKNKHKLSYNYSINKWNKYRKI